MVPNEDEGYKKEESATRDNTKKNEIDWAYFEAWCLLLTVLEGCMRGTI